MNECVFLRVYLVYLVTLNVPAMSGGPGPPTPEPGADSTAARPILASRTPPPDKDLGATLFPGTGTPPRRRSWRPRPRTPPPRSGRNREGAEPEPPPYPKVLWVHTQCPNYSRAMLVPR